MKKALIGYGGHAREVMAQMGVKLTCFVDDKYVVEGTKPISKFNPKKYALMVAVADSKDRFDIVQRLPKETKYFTWIHPTALIMSDDVEICEGSFIGAHSILTTNIKIGKHALLNRGNHIGHDCEIGDYFGTNASVKEKITIHNLTTIGSNAAVVKNIEEPGTYVGVSAKKIK
jgi:acetyltransferase-like isoleucine patch superfamily enzyme